jgi:outer membrane protein assembly factor BamB
LKGLMRPTVLAITVLAACGAPHPTEPAPTQPAPATPKHHVDEGAPPQGEIVTAQIKELNSDKYGRPPSTFRTGAVSPITPPRPEKTPTGYQVKFASHATIVTPTVYQHEVIVSGGFRSKELYAYESQTGKPLWGIDLGDDGPSASACEQGVCVLNTESCTIFAVDAKTGKQLWSYWLGDPLTSAPTISGNLVFAAYPAQAAEGGALPPGANHALAAFDLKTGKIAWQLWLDGDVMSAPVAAGEFLYVSTFAGTVIKVEQLTGKVRYAMKAKATSAPVVEFAADGVESMYYTRRGEQEKDGAEEMVIRADHNEPKTRYKTASKKAAYIDDKVQAKSAHAAASKDNDAANGFGGGAPAAAAPALAESQVGVGSVSSMQGFQGSRVLRIADKNVNTMGDEVVATNSDTGDKLWSYKLAGDTKTQGGFLGTAPLAAGNAIMLATLEGKVLELDPKTGTPIATYTVGAPVRSQPVVDSGWIYVGTEDGKLVAINSGDPRITGWPTWGGNAQRTGIAH